LSVLIAASLLSADFSSLATDVAKVERGGADLLHLDVMDGHFVPNITIGPAVTAALGKVTQLPLDCHLMIEEPDRYIADFAKAGAEMITVHVEVLPHLHRTLQVIREHGIKAGVALNPSTPLSTLREILPEVDHVLVMSVNPGFGGQKLIPSVLPKIRRLRERIVELGLDTRIEIDGGVTLDNLDDVAATGVDIIVAGSAVFGADPRSATREIVRRLAELAEHAEGR